MYTACTCINMTKLGVLVHVWKDQGHSFVTFVQNMMFDIFMLGKFSLFRVVLCMSLTLCPIQIV